PGIANAQDAVPSFNRDTHVYVESKLVNDAAAPVNIDTKQLEKDLKQLGKEQGLDFYFYFVEKGSQPVGQGENYAVVKARDFINKYQGQLPLDTYVVIYLVRSDKNKSAFSYAANGGNIAQKYGMDGNWFSDPNGVLFTAKKSYLPPDP